jgi:hypothetical protein
MAWILAPLLGCENMRIDFQDTDEHSFYSIIRGKHQYLDNENITIVETQKGRTFEVTGKGEIVLGPRPLQWICQSHRLC